MVNRWRRYIDAFRADTSELVSEGELVLETLWQIRNVYFLSLRHAN